MLKAHIPVKRTRAAFTLVELVITIALFLLVAGLVTSFIAFMGDFSETTDAQTARVEQTVDLRTEIDYWFSYFDKTEYTIQVFSDAYEGEGDGSGARTVAQAQTAGRSYRLRLGTFATGEPGETERALVAEYPEAAQHGSPDVNGSLKTVQVSCSAVERILLQPYASGWSPSSDGSTDYVRFIVSGKVGSWSYACTVLYG